MFSGRKPILKYVPPVSHRIQIVLNIQFKMLNGAFLCLGDSARFPAQRLLLQVLDAFCNLLAYYFVTEACSQDPSHSNCFFYCQ